MPRILAPDRIAADPFGEHRARVPSVRFRLLGANFHFSSDRPELLGMVAKTYSDLPRHRVGSEVPEIRVRLLRTDGAARPAWTTPPRVSSAAGAGLLCGTMDGGNYVALSPDSRAGLVAVSPHLLRFPYLARYELLEFAVYTLASRVQSLAPLHSASVAYGQRAALLMGDSGAGKTTLAAQSLIAGLDFLSEDSTFVSPGSGLATGIANYIHPRPEALRYWTARQAHLWRRNATTIRRRSGVVKLEVDLRRLGYRLAPRACRVAAIVFLTARSAGKGELLRPLTRRQALSRLEQLQPYAANQPNWSSFASFAGGLRFCELRRGEHPGAAVAPLRSLIAA